MKLLSTPTRQDIVNDEERNKFESSVNNAIKAINKRLDRIPDASLQKVITEPQTGDVSERLNRIENEAHRIGSSLETYIHSNERINNAVSDAMSSQSKQIDEVKSVLSAEITARRKFQTKCNSSIDKVMIEHEHDILSIRKENMHMTESLGVRISATESSSLIHRETLIAQMADSRNYITDNMNSMKHQLDSLKKEVKYNFEEGLQQDLKLFEDKLKSLMSLSARFDLIETNHTKLISNLNSKYEGQAKTISDLISRHVQSGNVDQEKIKLLIDIRIQEQDSVLKRTFEQVFVDISEEISSSLNEEAIIRAREISEINEKLKEYEKFQVNKALTSDADLLYESDVIMPSVDLAIALTSDVNLVYGTDDSNQPTTDLKSASNANIQHETDTSNQPNTDSILSAIADLHTESIESLQQTTDMTFESKAEHHSETDDIILPATDFDLNVNPDNLSSIDDDADMLEIREFVAKVRSEDMASIMETKNIDIPVSEDIGIIVSSILAGLVNTISVQSLFDSVDVGQTINVQDSSPRIDGTRTSSNTIDTKKQDNDVLSDSQYDEDYTGDLNHSSKDENEIANEYNDDISKDDDGAVPENRNDHYE